MDVVYIYKRNPGKETELKYSLRSVEKNLPMAKRVFFVGDRPEIAKRGKVGYLHCPGSDKNKYLNAFDKIMRAAESPHISDDFILMNDDFYILKPYKTLPYYYKTDLLSWYAKYQFRKVRYFSKIKATFNMVGNAKVFEVHFPFVFNKAKLLGLSASYSLPANVMLRTLYGAEYGVTGHKTRDYKALNENEVKLFSKKPFMSSSDEVAKSRVFVETMEKLFPYKSKWEK